MKKVFMFIAEHKFIVCLILLAAAVFAVMGAVKVRTDNSLGVWFVEKDPALEAYGHYQQVFGSDEKIGIMIRNVSGIKDEDFRVYVRNIQKSTKAMLNVDAVYGPYDMPGEPADFFLSDDKKAVTVIVSIKKTGDTDAARAEVIKQLRKLLAEKRTDSVKTALSGSGIVFDELNRISNADAGILIILSYGLMVIVMLLGGKHPMSVAVALGAIGVSTVYYMGVLGKFGSGINMVNMCVPSLMLILTIENFIHIGDHVLEGVPDLRSVTREMLAQRTADVFWPSFVAFFTTILGFLSLVFCNMKIIRDFGILVSVGLTLSFLTAFLLNTICFDLMIKFRVALKNREEAQNNSAAKFALFSKRFSVPMMIIFMLICAVSLWGVSMLKSDTYSLGYLKKSNAVRAESEMIEKDFGYYLALETVIKPRTGTCLSPRYTEGINKFIADVSAFPEIKDSLSVYDFTMQYKLMKMSGYPVSKTGFASMITPDEKMAKITFQIKMMSSSGIEKVLKKIEESAKRNLSPEIETEAAGYLPLYVKMMKYIDNVQRSSFPWAFVTIMLVIGFSLGSLRLAVLSVFPNLFPIALTMGIMGFLKIPLDVATITIASIAMGIVGDNGIHMMYTYKRAKGTEQEKWEEVFRGKFSPVTYTSIVLGAGFVVFAFSQVNSIAYFGIFSAVMIAASWIGNIFVMPSQFFLMKERDEK